ncbi:hypothetical protein KKC87_04420 [Patescibacteria group bacterium]|nr:hypothetical protein [Patescibacteria group bacterium]
MAGQTDRIITGFVAILIGVVLTPIVAQVVEDANLTGTTATVITLVPTFFALAILLLTVRSVMGAK